MSVTVVLLFLLTITLSSALIVCPKDYCSQIQCQEVTNCSGLNQAVRRGGFCSCCDVCYTILGENETCFQQILLGGPPPTVVCDDNLICREGTCQRV